MFRKHKLKQFVAKSLGKAGSSFSFPQDYAWKKTRFKIACLHYIELQKETSKFEKSSTQHVRDSRNFAKLFETHKNSQYDPSFIGLGEKHQHWMKDEYETLDEEKRKFYRGIEHFYNCFVDAIEKSSNEQEELTKKIQMFHSQIEDLLNDAKNGDKSKQTYENTLLNLSILQKKIGDEKKKLDTAEKKRASKKKMKEKEKIKKLEETILKHMIEREDEYEKLKKDTAFQEQRTLDELEYQVKRADCDFPLYMRNLLLQFKKYHENSLKFFNDCLSEVGIVDEEMENFQKRKERTFCKRIRPLFKPKIPTAIFGKEIDEVMKRENETGALPRTVLAMINHLSNNTFHEGIFRKPGNSEEMIFLQRHMDLGEITNFDDVAYIHNIGSMFKNYVRSLPSPLCPFDIFIAVYEVESEETQVQEVRKRVLSLSMGKQNLLYYLLRLCDKIQQQANLNKMDTSNLSLVWSMNVIPPSETDPISLIDITPKVRHIMNVMIKRFSDVFPEGPPRHDYEKVKLKFFEEEESEESEGEESKFSGF